MEEYNKERIREKIKKIMDAEYERMYPFDLEKALGELVKKAQDNKDEEVLKELKWEFDLLNSTFGHITEYKGQAIEEISNKWKYFLDSGEFKPLSNPPFCQWEKDASKYYIKRYKETKSYLSKARYSFAIMVFSYGRDSFYCILHQ
jgi:hypothetical protein